MAMRPLFDGRVVGCDLRGKVELVSLTHSNTADWPPKRALSKILPQKAMNVRTLYAICNILIYRRQTQLVLSTGKKITTYMRLGGWIKQWVHDGCL